MNWYELASPDEVKRVLEHTLESYNFITYKFEKRWSDKENRIILATVSKFPSQAYEMAEALWGEHSEEWF